MNKELQKLSNHELENISGGINKKVKYFLLGALTATVSIISIYKVTNYIINKKIMKKANRYQHAFFGD